jgi:stearoyl-CoA desaturase (delta-9 desaturase)
MNSVKSVDSPKSLDWVNILFLVVTPPLTVSATVMYIMRNGIHPVDITLFLLFYLLTGISITAGYHRYYSHRSYDCHPAIQLFYLLFGAAAIENSALRWSRDHRLHHQYVDQEQDPYNIKRGLFYAHMGWIFYQSEQDRNYKCAPDLLKDKLVVWQERYYLPILILIGFGLPTLIGALVSRPFGGFLWGGLLRVFIVQHMTFCINSLAHYFGSQPYSIDNTSRDSWWLAFLTYGEGYHNFHHRFPADHRNAYHWYQFDPTKWWIKSLAVLGLVTRMSRYRDETILKARLETDMKRVALRIAHAPEGLSLRIQRRMQAARHQVETAYSRWEMAKTLYRKHKRPVSAGSARISREWKLRSRAYKFEFQAAQARWAILILTFSRFHGPCA